VAMSPWSRKHLLPRTQFSTVVKADHRKAHLKEKSLRRTYRPNNQNNKHRQQVTFDAPKIGGVPFLYVADGRQAKQTTMLD